MRTPYAIHILILTVVFAVLFLLLFIPWSGYGADEVFYYAYISSFLFDFDIDVTNDIASSNNSFEGISNLLKIIGPKGQIKNLFAIGTAILNFPFVFLVWITGMMFQVFTVSLPEWVHNRFSAPYLFAVSMSALCYGYLTLIMLYHICLYYFCPRVSLFATLGVCFASPLLCYIFFGSAMSHTASAFSVTLLVYLVLRYRTFPDFGAYILIALSLGMVTLVRWQNIIFVIIPVAYWISYMVRRQEAFSRDYFYFGSACAIFSLMISIQFCYWYAQMGRFLIIPQGPGFICWGKPHILKVLFSGWHGFYYWHPLMFLASAGLILFSIGNKNKITGIAYLLVFLILVYINSSVKDWYCGSSFGTRRFSCALPLLGIGLGTIYAKFRRRFFIIPVAITITAICANIILYALYTRQIFDMYFLKEIWRLRSHVSTVFSDFMCSIPLSSFIIFNLKVTGNIFYGISIAGIGLCLIWGLFALLMVKRFTNLERHAPLFAFMILCVIVVLDIMMIVNPLPFDENGKQFASIMSRINTSSAPEIYKSLKELIDKGYSNPVVFTYAYNLDDEPERLKTWLERVYSVSQRYWALWINSLPTLECSSDDETLAQSLIKPEIRSPVGFYYDKINTYRTCGNIRVEKRWLKRFLRYNPFNVNVLNRLVELYRNEGDSRKKSLYDVRLKSYLESKWQTYRGVEQSLGRYKRRLFNEYFRNYILSLASYYENNGNLDGAVQVYESIKHISVREHEIRQAILRLSIKKDMTDYDIITAPHLVDSPDTEVDTFILAAKSSIASGNLETAIRILITGYTYHPQEYWLYHYLNQILQTYEVNEIPFDLLCSEQVDSYTYWLSVADYLNKAHRYASAAHVLKDYIDEIKKDTWGNFVYGYALFHLGEYTDAEEFLGTAFEKNPVYATYGIYYGRSLIEQKKYAQAFEVLKEAVEHNLDDLELRSLLKHTGKKRFQ